jgi:predicted RNase H-like HicB family nuclease
MPDAGSSGGSIGHGRRAAIDMPDAGAFTRLLPQGAEASLLRMTADSTHDGGRSPGERSRIDASPATDLAHELEALPYYPAGVEPPAADAPAWGGEVPDLPGCVASGATLEDVMARLVEAMHAWITEVERRGGAIPEPASLDTWARSPHYNGWLWLLIQRPPTASAIKLEDLTAAQSEDTDEPPSQPVGPGVGVSIGAAGQDVPN